MPDGDNMKDATGEKRGLDLHFKKEQAKEYLFVLIVGIIIGLLLHGV